MNCTGASRQPQWRGRRFQIFLLLVFLCELSCFSRVQLFVTPRTAAHQAPLSMGFSRQEYWSGLSCPPPGDLPDPGVEPASLMSPALAGGFFTTSTTWEALVSLQAPSNLWFLNVEENSNSSLFLFLNLHFLSGWSSDNSSCDSVGILKHINISYCSSIWRLNSDGRLGGPALRTATEDEG